MATQVLSNTVSNFIDIILNLSGGVVQTRRGDITFSKTAETTSIILSFFNDLFDSLNGNKGQGLSSILTPNSGHISFWKEACNKLRNMQYVEKGTRQILKKNKPKSLKNWIWTIKAVQEIWRILQDANFETLNLKFLNQDVIENFFSQIRNFGGSNRNPNPKQFQEAFKALLICNITSKHSFGANCADDNVGQSLALSQMMKSVEIVNEREVSKKVQDIDTEQAAIPQATINEITLDFNKIITSVSYDQNIVECPTCSNNLNDTELLKHVVAKLEIKFVEICCELKVTEKIQNIFKKEQHLLSSPCTHLRTKLFEIVSHEFITIWCKFINNILCKKTVSTSDNYMYKAAQRLSIKYKKISENK